MWHRCSIILSPWVANVFLLFFLPYGHLILIKRFKDHFQSCYFFWVYPVLRATYQREKIEVKKLVHSRFFYNSMFFHQIRNETLESVVYSWVYHIRVHIAYVRKYMIAWWVSALYAKLNTTTSYKDTPDAIIFWFIVSMFHVAKLFFCALNVFCVCVVVYYFTFSHVRIHCWRLFSPKKENRSTATVQSWHIWR